MICVTFKNILLILYVIILSNTNNFSLCACLDHNFPSTNNNNGSSIENKFIHLKEQQRQQNPDLIPDGTDSNQHQVNDNKATLFQYCKVCRFNAIIYNTVCNTNYDNKNSEKSNRCLQRNSDGWNLLSKLENTAIQVILQDIIIGSKKLKWQIDWICCNSPAKSNTSKIPQFEEFCTEGSEDLEIWAYYLSLASNLQQYSKSNSKVIHSPALPFCTDNNKVDKISTPSDNDENNILQSPAKLKRRFDLLLACLTMVSILLLLATIIVYLCLPALLNIHGKTIVLHLICLMIAYCFQMAEYYHTPIIRDNGSSMKYNTNVKLPSENQISDDHHNNNLLTDDEYNGICFGLGIGLYGTSFAAFLWLCIVNFDIFTTFITDAGKTHPSSSNAKMKFRRYCIFGFGIPAIFTSIILILEYVLVDDNEFKPMIGSTRCFIPSGRVIPIFLYYYGPITFLLIINLIMFTWASIFLWSAQSKAKNLKENASSTSTLILERLFLFFKLFCVMGTTMTINIILWLTGNHHEVLPGSKHGAARFFECFNVFHGFCYFIVFVCKPSVFKMLHVKFCTTAPHFDTRASRSVTSNSSYGYGRRINKASINTGSSSLSSSTKG